jgi:formylglycine-generating enzyme
MAFGWCPPGEFAMGSPREEKGRDADERRRTVTFERGFWMAKHPCSQRQWTSVMPENPSRKGREPDCPVDNVSWRDAVAFCSHALVTKALPPGWTLGLPLEAQWEYACRAGTPTPFGIGAGVSLNAQTANFDGSNPYGGDQAAFKWLYRNRTLPAGAFPPNAWGLHDMHGQLWEWCADFYNPNDKDDSRPRVLRGGSWIFKGFHCRSACRYRYDPANRCDRFGFRPVPVPPPASSGASNKASEGRTSAAREGQPRAAAEKFS